MASLFFLTSARARTLIAFVLFGGPASLIGVSPVNAAPLTLPVSSALFAVANPALDVETPTAALFDDAMYLLKRGRRFETCIEKLSEAVRREPENAAFHRALACAYVNRAVVVADASVTASYKAEVRARYPAILAQWEKAQQDENAPLFGTPKPPPPPPVQRTADDNKPFTLTPAEATSKATPLAEAAIKEFALAVTLCKTPEERAETEYERGWGLFLLEKYTSRKLVFSLTRTRTHKDVVDAFLTATTSEPDNPIYWQSLGEAYSASSSITKEKNRSVETISAYERALSLRRANPALWYRLYVLQEADFPDKAEVALRKAVDRDPGNAFLRYRLAEWLMRQHSESPDDTTHSDALSGNAEAQAITRRKNAEGIRYVQRGNVAVANNAVIERLAIPPTLTAAWNYIGGDAKGR